MATCLARGGRYRAGAAGPPRPGCDVTARAATGRLCPLPHYDRQPDGSRTVRERPTLAAAGSRLCAGHDRRTADDLAGLLELTVDLHGQLASAAAGGPKVTGTPGHALPGDLDAAELLRVVHVELAGWCRTIAVERSVALPTADTVPALVRHLHRHLSWALDQPWSAELAGRLRSLHTCGALVIAPRPAVLTLGVCGRVVACDVTTRSEQACPGALRAVVRRDDDRLPDVVCAACGAAHPPAQYRTLARRLAGTDDTWVTIPQASALLGVPARTLRRWCAGGDWRHEDTHPRRRYHLADVTATVHEQMSGRDLGACVDTATTCL